MVDSQQIAQYLKYGSIFDVEYEDPKKYQERDLDDYFDALELPDGYYLASSGGIDSSIIWKLKQYPSFCVSSIGNQDIYYAKLLNPSVTEIKFDVDLEHELILTAKLWDKPHCGKTDAYDHFVYRQFDKIITGEELYHLDTFRILNKKGDYIDRFTETVEIFTDDEIKKFGYEPYRIELRENSIFHLEYFLYDCWTKVSRKIFYRFDRVISPFLTKKFIDYYKSLLISQKTHKKLQKTIAEKLLPKEVFERKKFYHIDGPNELFLEAYKKQYDYLIDKYLRDKNLKIFNILNFNEVQKYLNNYRKMWNILNLSIWLEGGKKCLI